MTDHRLIGILERIMHDGPNARTVHATTECWKDCLGCEAEKLLQEINASSLLKNQMNTDTPQDPATPADMPAPSTSLPVNLKYVMSFFGGAVFAVILVILFSGHISGSPAAATPPVPPAAQPRTVQVVTLFNCQYLSFTEPFFILHLPKCTNHPPERRLP